MRPPSLRPALLAALAALLLAAGLAPPSEASDDAAEGGMITTLLHPGWNMVGWVGPAAPTSELFEALPQLQTVGAWDASAGAYRYAWPGSNNDVPAVTPGMGLWLYLGGDRQLYWTRPGTSDGVVLRLGAGRHLVGVVADGAVKPPEDAEARAWRWDPLRQNYEPYRFGDATLRGGEALWVEAAAPFNLWQPGTEPPPFVFLGEVSDDSREPILTEYASIRRHLAEHFAVAIRGGLQYVGADIDAIRPLHIQFFRREPPDGFCGGSHEGIRLTIVRCATPPRGLLDYEYVSDLLLQIPGKGLAWREEPSLDPRGPGWLIKGARWYAVTSYREATPGREDQRRDLETAAKRIAVPLSHFEVSENRDGTTNNTERALGFFAVEWLAERAGNPAVFNYFKLMRTSDDWRETFETAFGLSVEDFYEQFAVARAEDPLPLPHLIDDLDEPVLVFVGDVPEDKAAAIRTEFEHIQQFFANRFEARATEFTMYVTPDRDSAISTFPERRFYACELSPLHGRLIVPLDQCGPRIQLEYMYVRALVGELSPLSLLRFTRVYVYTEDSRGPNWLTAGLEEYAAAAYRAAARGTDLAAGREWYVRRARTISHSLRNTATGSGGPVLTLGYLAADRLVERAGEPAVFEYYRKLLTSTSPAQAFRSAFGLTLEESYLEFEAYRAGLAAQ
ncbi:MAG: hypothetical protein F4Z25_05720 [Chloroflexi bacterium]|nr:hypothetical protein [Chloroflexota bacterium]